MVVLNWLILLAVSEILLSFFNLKGFSVWFFTLGHDNKNIIGGGRDLHFTFDLWGNLCSLKIWWDLKFWGVTNPSYIPWVVVETCKLVDYQSLLVFMFCQIVALVFQTWYVCRRAGANTWLNCQFSRKICSCF